jgi:hypothetical protein
MKTCTKVRLAAVGVFTLAVVLLAIESKMKDRRRQA